MTAPVGSAAAFYALDAAYRAAVANTSLAVLRAMAGAWRLLDPDDLSRTSSQWLEGSVQAVLAGQRDAVRLASTYADQVRRLSVPDAPLFVPPNPRPPNAEQVRSSLEFTGIKETARAIYRAESVQQTQAPDVEPVERDSTARTTEGTKQRVMQEGLSRAAGSAIRLVNTAGRDQLEDIVRADAVAIGWARSTKPGCCYFCAMLASRGYVYKETSFEASNAQFKGVGEQKVHDNCGCGLRPIYNPFDPLPDRVEELDQMWQDMKDQRRPGETDIQAFRRIYEASPLAQPFTAA